jgi:hypothetical protein
VTILEYSNPYRIKEPLVLVLSRILDESAVFMNYSGKNWQV